MFRSIISAITHCIAKFTSTRSKRPAWRCCTTRCCITSSWAAENEQEYVAEFVYNYGHWSEDLARELWRRRSRSAADPEYFRYPMIKRVVERSQSVIVHNPRAAALVHEHVRGATVHEIPLLFELPADLPPRSEVIRWRARLGVPASTFLVGVFGYLRESKRLLALLRAFQRARRSADIVLLIAGDFVSSDLARAVEPMLRDDAGILRIGYLDDREFWLCASAVDACINLRYPMAGETSAIAIRLMGLGKTVLVSAGEETSRFPEAACVRVDPGQAEEEMLTEYLVWLARCPGRRPCHWPTRRRTYPRTSRPRSRGRTLLARIDGLLS